jgi:DM9 repeat
MTNSIINILILVPFILSTSVNFTHAKSYYNKKKTIYTGGVSTKVAWQKANGGTIPSNAFVGASSDQGPVYICQARSNMAVLPGQIVNNKCVVTQSGQPHLVDEYQVLVSQEPLQWLDMSSLYRYYSRKSMGILAKNSWMMPGISIKAKAEPIVGGYEMKNRYYPQPLFICRTMYGTQIHMGKLVSNKCMVRSNGQEVSTTMFQVLAIQKTLDGLN